MKDEKNVFSQDEILYGCCSSCGKSFPIDDLALAPKVEAFYRSYLLRVEKGENPKLDDDDFCEGIYCKDCQPF